MPDSQDFGYDCYATLDVKDKIVLVLRYFPEDADLKTRGIVARYSDLRYKAMAARQHGAKAMLVVTGPRLPNAGELAPMTFDTAIAGSGIVALTITSDVANTLFQESLPDKTLANIAEGANCMDCGTSGRVTQIASHASVTPSEAPSSDHRPLPSATDARSAASGAEGHADGQFAAARGQAPSAGLRR